MRAGAIAAAALAVVAAAGRASAQAPVEARVSPLFSAWLAEHLRREPQAARAAYERVLADEDEISERRAVAAARLAEMDRVLGDTEALDRHISLVRTALGTESNNPIGVLETRREPLREALAMPPGAPREEALAIARALLEEDLDRSRTPGRSIVSYVVRRLAANRDAERQRLERELSSARAAGDAARVRELQGRLQTPRNRSREADVDRARAWRVRVAGLLTEARFELAELLLARFPAAGSTGDGAQRLARTLARSDLHPLERNALEALDERVKAWRKAGRSEARRALALLPY